MFKLRFKAIRDIADTRLPGIDQDAVVGSLPVIPAMLCAHALLPFISF